MLAIIGGGGLAGLFFAQFALSGLNPFYQNAPLPGPLVAVPEPGPAALPEGNLAVATADWSYPAPPVDRIGYDPGPPDPSLDLDDPPPPEPLLVDEPLAPRATIATLATALAADASTPSVTIAKPAPPVAVVTVDAPPR
ncbi:MAG: hypothetical protein A4S16_05150 [Proteobacteria bacterium SG_bin6]|nr:MAG: hypothetical protein A4S16_05150 [Proteobacteria bacterium SG_bin6]